MIEVVSELKFPPFVEEVKNRVGAIKRDIPPHHGVAHDLSVVRYGTYLALTEGAIVENVQTAVFLHDLRWWDDEEKRARKIAPQEDGESLPSVTDILNDLRGRRRITQEAYDDILYAVINHNQLPQSEVMRPLTTKCVADADRLSRFGVGGLLSILEANATYGVPFYIPGSVTTRPDNAPMIPFDQIKSCVDDINACIDWVHIMETPNGSDLASHLSMVNRTFLETFEGHQNLSYDVWIPWLRSIIITQASWLRRLEELLNQKQLDKFKSNLFMMEDPDLVHQDRFALFRYS